MLRTGWRWEQIAILKKNMPASIFWRSKQQSWYAPSVYENNSIFYRMHWKFSFKVCFDFNLYLTQNVPSSSHYFIYDKHINISFTLWLFWNSVTFHTFSNHRVSVRQVLDLWFSLFLSSMKPIFVLKLWYKPESMTALCAIIIGLAFRRQWQQMKAF